MKRNAFSGGKGLGCPSAASASANPPTTNAPRSHLPGHCFRCDPGQIFGQTIGDWDGDYLWKFVGMPRSDSGFQSGITAGASLDRDRRLVGSFDFSLPVIE